jgi:hypothetical protein
MSKKLIFILAGLVIAGGAAVFFLTDFQCRGEPTILSKMKPLEYSLLTYYTDNEKFPEQFDQLIEEKYLLPGDELYEFINNHIIYISDGIDYILIAARGDKERVKASIDFNKLKANDDVSARREYLEQYRRLAFMITSTLLNEKPENPPSFSRLYPNTK